MGSRHAHIDDVNMRMILAYTTCADWDIGIVPQSWTTPAHLVEVAWLDSAKDPPLPNSVFPDHERRECHFRSRVIEPLVGFGLLESRDLPAKERWENPIEVRKTALYDRALQFRFGGSAG
jgi:hypothetical protein